MKNTFKRSMTPVGNTFTNSVLFLFFNINKISRRLRDTQRSLYVTFYQRIEYDLTLLNLIRHLLRRLDN